MAGCPFHGYSCGGNCMAQDLMSQQAAQQQMGQQQYNYYLREQMTALQQRGLPISMPVEDKPKPNKLLLLLR